MYFKIEVMFLILYKVHEKDSKHKVAYVGNFIYFFTYCVSMEICIDLFQENRTIVSFLP